MNVTALQAIRHYEENQAQGLAALGWFARLEDRLEADITTVEGEEAAARVALAAAYLPELTSEALARVETLSGYGGFARRDPLEAMAHEEKVLRGAIARIEADERYVRREYLVGPSGEYTRERAEAASMLEPWEQECARFESLDGFTELLEVGYDTPGFSVSWWVPRYWKLWANGDRICRELGLDDFGDDVLPAWQQVEAPRARWRAEVARIDALIDGVHELVRTHDEALARIPRLPEIYLEACHGQLAEFLVHADYALLEQWLDTEERGGGGPYRAVRMALRRAAGVEAKLGYLREALTQGVQATMAQLRERVAKHQRKAAKFARPKYRNQRIPASWLDGKFPARVVKLRGRHDKLTAQLDRLMAFDDYGSFVLTDNDPELWYVAMTRKRPSRLIPATRHWYDRHPDREPVRVERDDDDDALAHGVALAAATWDRDDTGYIS